MSATGRAYALIIGGLVAVIWFGLGLPPTGGPAVQIIGGGNDVATGVAIPYLIIVLAGIAAFIWGLGILLTRPAQGE